MFLPEITATENEMKLWLVNWTEQLGQGATLMLTGEVGFGRECVGIMCGKMYLSVTDVWSVRRPPDAYHKWDVLCVLGHGFDPLSQLYQWCRDLDAAGVELVIEERYVFNQVDLLLNGALEPKLRFKGALTA